MARKLRIKTFSCGCVEKEEISSAFATEDIEEANAYECYQCSAIKPRPPIGATTRFLRFGLPPASGRSHNYRDNHDEAGVSVYAIVKGKLISGCGLVGFLDRPAYRGTGVVVGYGSDDEVLVEIQAIRKISDRAMMELAYPER